MREECEASAAEVGEAGLNTPAVLDGLNWT